MREQILEHLKQFFRDESYTYHSYDHSLEVALRAKLIGEREGLSPNDLEILDIAALFHDTGYPTNPEKHEEIGAQFATDYLISIGYSVENIDKVSRIILATRMTGLAETLLEKIIKDADVGPIGQEDYEKHANALRQEKAKILNEVYSDLDWIKLNQDFVKGYKWKTKSGKKIYNKQRKIHLEDLDLEAKRLKFSQNAKVPTRGIETMFRVALRNHNQLSKIADNKANILLSITALMLSIIISALAPKIDSNPNLMIPMIIIVTVCLVTMIFAILATRPKVSSAKYSREKLLNNEINLLFFGNFYNIPVEEFEWGMEQLMSDKELLYGSLSKDLYYLGSVLARKYKYLQVAYIIFMFGLIISTLAFILTLWLSHH